MARHLPLFSASAAGPGPWHPLHPRLCGPFAVIGAKHAADQIRLEGRIGALTLVIDDWTGTETGFGRVFDAPFERIRVVKTGASAVATVLLRGRTHE